MSVSQSLQRDLNLARRSRRCADTGGHRYGKPFERRTKYTTFWKQKCKRCKQEIILTEHEALSKIFRDDYVK